MSHIIGRPNDDLLDVMLGHGADPEQAIIGGSEQGLEEADGFEDRLPGDAPEDNAGPPLTLPRRGSGSEDRRAADAPGSPTS